ncbi:hypothetical protein PC116_g33708, partial [Phytophthora cactorum]
MLHCPNTHLIAAREPYKFDIDSVAPEETLQSIHIQRPQRLREYPAPLANGIPVAVYLGLRKRLLPQSNPLLEVELVQTVPPRELPLEIQVVRGQDYGAHNVQARAGVPKRVDE